VIAEFYGNGRETSIISSASKMQIRRSPSLRPRFVQGTGTPIWGGTGTSGLNKFADVQAWPDVLAGSDARGKCDGRARREGV